MGVETQYARIGRRHLGWTLAAACLLAAGRLADAQSVGRITVTSPARDDIIHAGDPVMVTFNATGDAASGTYDIDLLKGNNEVQSFCSQSEGCDITGIMEDGFASGEINLSPTLEVDGGYSIRVTDRNTSISGSSFPFDVLPVQSSNSTEIASPEFQDEVGGAAGVGDMGLAMVVVAAVCGLAIACTCLSAGCIACRRRATKENTKDLEASTADVEAGAGGGSLHPTTPGKLNESSSSGQRGFSSGQQQQQPLKAHTPGGGSGGGSQGQRTPGRSQGQRTPARRSFGDSGSRTPGRRGLGDSGSRTPGRRTPGPTIAMGSNQRGRSLQRSLTGPQVYGGSSGGSNTPSRSGGHRSVSQLQERPGEFARGNSGHATMTPGRRRSGDDGRGYRRSKSERYDLSPSAHSFPREDQAGGGSRLVGDSEQARRSNSYRRSQSSSARPRSMRDVHDRDSRSRSRSRPTTPSRHQGYQSGMPATPPDVSWEELRSTHQREKARGGRAGGIRRTFSLPTYGEAIEDDRGPSPSYGPYDAASSKSVTPSRRSVRSGGTAGSTRSFASSGRAGVSPSSRAVSARNAARDAQLSAEKALRAAAMASKAADLAAQAALEAEAEADAELMGEDTYGESQPSPSETSTVREKIKSFSRTEETEVKVQEGAEPSSPKAKGKPDTSWLKSGVRGPDTAGGSTPIDAADGTPSAPLPSDPEELAMKKRAFAKHYSKSGSAGDVDEDSVYSPSEISAAAAATATAVFGGQPAVADSNGHEQPAPEEEHTEQDFTTGGKKQGTPKRVRSPHDVHIGGVSEGWTKARRGTSPVPSDLPVVVGQEVHIDVGE